MTAIAALAIGLAISEAARFADREAAHEREREVAANLTAARSEAQSALAAVIQPETIESADRSVYLVTVDGNPNGTAFVVDRDRGILATAAHVVDSLPLDEDDRRIEILNQHTGARIPVAAARMHAGYGSFSRAVEAYQPMRRDTKLTRPRVVAVEETPFDAGVIVVEPIDARSGANVLGPNLPLASEDTLTNLRAGDPIAIIGFPRDRVGGGQLGAVADSRAERGVISAMVAPVDNARIARDPAIANLIVHRMATAGGNSGSPVLNAAGEVVGVHTHGVSGQDSNGDGLAQRADILLDLLEPLREEKRLATLFRPAWKERLQYWARAEELLPWAFFEAETVSEDDDQARNVDDVNLKGPAPFEYTTYEARFSEDALRYVADADDLGGDGMKIGGDGLTASNQPAFVIDEKGEYFEQMLFVDPDNDNLIYAFDYAVNNGVGYCPLTLFWRRAGEDRLEVVRSKAAAKLYLPAEDNEAGRIHLIFKRSVNCDPRSRDFFFGAMEWDPAKADEGRADEERADEPPANVGAGAAHGAARLARVAVNGIDAAGAAFRRFVDCRISPRGSRSQCAEPEFVPATTVHAEEISRPPVQPVDADPS